MYGSLGKSGYFTESSAYKPNSPYSASKASSDHFVRSYGKTYSMPYVISNCSNNFGENQYPEKLIPLLINNIINNLPLQFMEMVKTHEIGCMLKIMLMLLI